MAHLQNSTLAQSQKAKIEHLVKKARVDRYNVAKHHDSAVGSGFSELQDRVDPISNSTDAKTWKELQEKALATLTNAVRVGYKRNNMKANESEANTV